MKGKRLQLSKQNHIIRRAVYNKSIFMPVYRGPHAPEPSSGIFGAKLPSLSSQVIHENTVLLIWFK